MSWNGEFYVGFLWHAGDFVMICIFARVPKYVAATMDFKDDFSCQKKHFAEFKKMSGFAFLYVLRWKVQDHKMGEGSSNGGSIQSLADVASHVLEPRPFIHPKLRWRSASIVSREIIALLNAKRWDSHWFDACYQVCCPYLLYENLLNILYILKYKIQHIRLSQKVPPKLRSLLRRSPLRGAT